MVCLLADLKEKVEAVYFSRVLYEHLYSISFAYIYIYVGTEYIRVASPTSSLLSVREVPLVSHSI